jgi:catechol 2,3-dioxygenase-like lactoylglutathione lyase family enzyme
MFLSYTGIRVQDLERSLALYSGFFGLREVRRGENTPHGGGTYVLLRDPVSGQRLELNWYPPGSPHDTPYVPGEGLDHVAFRVDDVDATVRALVARGLVVALIDPDLAEPQTDRAVPGWFKVAYVKDPDGNWIELYQRARPEPYRPDGY